MFGTAYHFSHDPTITEFLPHVAATSVAAQAYVWAVDAEHSPAYWFPRDCPRITFWSVEPPDEKASLLLGGGAGRVHAVEWDWLPRIRQAQLYPYSLDPAPFRPWPQAPGYLVAEQPVRPQSVEPVGDLLAAHRDAGIELRLVSNRWPLADAVAASGLQFSMIRMRYAAPRR